MSEGDHRPAQGLDAFLADAEDFLRSNAKRKTKEWEEWGEGSDEVGVIPARTPEEEAEEIHAAKEWRALEFDAGFGWISGPVEFGGRGLPDSYTWAYQELKAAFDTPNHSIFGGIGIFGPTILAHGSASLKERYLRPIHRGEISICQLFSEPGAGSDLASMTTTAVRDGDDWIVNGQKVWCSNAHVSEIGELLCRTNPAAAKHRGITAFLLELNTPGVEVRPLRQMSGGAHFNEVFLDNVRIADADRLGEIDHGWSVAMSTMTYERGLLTPGVAVGEPPSLRRVIDLARWLGRDSDPLVRHAIADAHIHYSIARWNNERSLERLRSGQEPGSELHVAKLIRGRNYGKIAELVSLLLGPRLAADTGEWGTYAWSELVLEAPAMRIAGGTDEIVRNIVAERVLGLPRDVSPGKLPPSGR